MTTQHELLDAAIRKVGNRYLTTMLIAKRIRQLHHGAPSYVSRDENESYFTVAVREIAEGHLTLASTEGIWSAFPEPPDSPQNGAADVSTAVIEPHDES